MGRAPHALVIAWSTLVVVSGGQFSLFRKSAHTWSDSHDDCVSEQRVIAKVDSQEKQNWVERLQPYSENYFWIGLHRESHRDPFLWKDDTVPTYTNWAPGYPRDTLSNDHCVVIRPGDFKWETCNCERDQHYLCEDEEYLYSETISEYTKYKGLLMGLGVFGSLLLLSCLVFQTSCCRTGVTQKIAQIGFGKRNIDTNKLVA